MVMIDFVLWKNDRAVKFIKLAGKAENVELSLSDFYCGNEKLSSENLVSIVEATKAFTGHPGGGFNQANYPVENSSNRKLSYDIISGKTSMNVEDDLCIFLSINTSANAKNGEYLGELVINRDGEFEHIDIRIEVIDYKLEISDDFDFEFWQHPFSSAEYYGAEAFSKKHMQILEELLGKYKESFGNAITASIIDDPWDRQTYSKNDIHYPSMIKWTIIEGKFEFDYEIFDKWVDLCLSCGLGRKIACYGIAPWHDSFRYEEDGSYIVRPFDKGADEYREIWRTFLEDFSSYLQGKNWFDMTYIGIDERGFSKELVDLIKSVKVDNSAFKICAAIDNIVDNYEIVKDFEDLTIGDNIPEKYPNVYADLIKYRKSKKLKTTLYSCTGHIPGNFSLSLPEESLWSILNSYKNHADGFLRWAYDAWVEDSLRDATHYSFEAGDCFLIYPREKNDDKYFYTSVRLEMMIYGLFLVNKLRILADLDPKSKPFIWKMLNYYIKSGYDTNGLFLSDVGRIELKNDIENFIEEIDKLSKNLL